jgi:hypothetical protein
VKLEYFIFKPLFIYIALNNLIFIIIMFWNESSYIFKLFNSFYNLFFNENLSFFNYDYFICHINQIENNTNYNIPPWLKIDNNRNIIPIYPHTISTTEYEWIKDLKDKINDLNIWYDILSSRIVEGIYNNLNTNLLAEICLEIIKNLPGYSLNININSQYTFLLNKNLCIT